MTHLACPENKILSTSQKGSTLVEVMVAIVLLSMVTIPFILGINNLNRKFVSLSSLSRGYFLSQRNLEIIANLAQYDWDELPRDSENQIIVNEIFHLTHNGSQWRFDTGTEVTGPFTNQVVFKTVCRNAQFESVNCDDEAVTSYDPNSIKVVSQTTWQQDNRTENITLEGIYTFMF